MPTLADHFSEILKNATLSHTSLHFDSANDLFSLLKAAAADPAAKGIELLANASPDEILRKVMSAGIEPGLLAKLAQTVGFSELPGNDPYETFDPNWIGCLLNYYKYRSQKISFPKPPKLDDVVSTLIDEKEIRIGIVGDWGAGEWEVARGSGKVSKPIARNVVHAMAMHAPHYAIHLGDVYYSGDGDQETTKFLDLWRPSLAASRSYALNSNHEMYSGGNGYYGTLLKDPMFQATQNGIGYFALTNSQWLIIGLDSAYFSTSHLYQDGALRDPSDPSSMDQVNWLTYVLQANPNKRVIIMTHHDGFDVDPKSGNVKSKALYSEITRLMTGVNEWWWYWGHVHTVIAYRSISLANSSRLTPRCVGHGAIPYMPFQLPLAELGRGDFAIEWAPTGFAGDPDIPLRALNGFALLTLSGAKLKEEFFDENNNLVWSKS